MQRSNKAELYLGDIFFDRRRMTLAALIGMIVFPIFVHLVVKYICTYLTGDIQYKNITVVLDYIYYILSHIVNYVGFGILLWSIHCIGVKKSRLYIIFSAFGIMIPYLSAFMIEALIGSILQTYKIHLFSFNMYPFDLLTFMLIVFLLPAVKHFNNAKLRNKRRKQTVKGKEIKVEGRALISNTDFTYSEKELSRANLFTALLMLLLALVNELYYTVTFFWQLKNEYFRQIDPSELISMVTLYFECFFFAFIGYVLMRLISLLLNKVVLRQKKN